MILGSRQIDAGDDAYNGTAADQRELQDPIVARRMNVSAVAAGLEPLRASPEFAQIAAKAERREREFREQ